MYESHVIYVKAVSPVSKSDIKIKPADECMKLTGYEGAMNKSTDEQGAGTVFVVHPSFGEALKFWLKLGFSVSEVRPGKFPSCTRSWLGKNAE